MNKTPCSLCPYSHRTKQRDSIAHKCCKAIGQQVYEHRRNWLESLAISIDIAKGDDPSRSKMLMKNHQQRKEAKKIQEMPRADMYKHRRQPEVSQYTR